MSDTPGIARAAGTPLGVITAFITLAEVVAGSAAIISEGTPQMMFTIFAVAFPLVVLGVFTFILVKFPLHLYAPGDHDSTDSLNAFANALNRHQRSRQSLTIEAVKQALTEVLTDQSGTPNMQSDTEIADSFEAAFERVFEAGTVTVGRSSLLGSSAHPVRIPVDSGTSVQDFLDSVYFELDGVVPAFSYGDEWILTLNGEPMVEMGSAWARRRGQLSDYRPLTAAGIKAGMTLHVDPA